jgi:hypothetical protein
MARRPAAMKLAPRQGERNNNDTNLIQHHTSSPYPTTLATHETLFVV